MLNYFKHSFSTSLPLQSEKMCFNLLKVLPHLLTRIDTYNMPSVDFKVTAFASYSSRLWSEQANMMHSFNKLLLVTMFGVLVLALWYYPSISFSSFIFPLNKMEVAVTR